MSTRTAGSAASSNRPSRYLASDADRWVVLPILRREARGRERHRRPPARRLRRGRRCDRGRGRGAPTEASVPHLPQQSVGQLARRRNRRENPYPASGSRHPTQPRPALTTIRRALSRVGHVGVRRAQINRVIDLIYNALAPVLPNDIIADSSATLSFAVDSGVKPHGEYRVFLRSECVRTPRCCQPRHPDSMHATARTTDARRRRCTAADNSSNGSSHERTALPGARATGRRPHRGQARSRVAPGADSCPRLREETHRRSTDHSTTTRSANPCALG